VLGRLMLKVHGIEFLTLSIAMVDRVERMSTDYMNCELRIRGGAREACRTDCAFYTMCTKKEKLEIMTSLDRTLNLNFQPVTDPKIARPPA
jgi:hypothetical protein